MVLYTTEEHCSAMRKKEIFPFVTIWMGLEGITLSKIRKTEKDKYYLTSRYVECKKAKLIKTKSRTMDSRGWEVGKLGKGYLRIQICKQEMSSGDVMHSIVIIVNNTIL